MNEEQEQGSISVFVHFFEKEEGIKRQKEPGEDVRSDESTKGYEEGDRQEGQGDGGEVPGILFFSAGPQQDDRSGHNDQGFEPDQAGNAGEFMDQEKQDFRCPFMGYPLISLCGKREYIGTGDGSCFKYQFAGSKMPPDVEVKQIEQGKNQDESEKGKEWD